MTEKEKMRSGQLYAADTDLELIADPGGLQGQVLGLQPDAVHRLGQP